MSDHEESETGEATEIDREGIETNEDREDLLLLDYRCSLASLKQGVREIERIYQVTKSSLILYFPVT